MADTTSPLDRSRARTWLCFVCVLAVYLVRLDAPTPWNDEADTAILARAVRDTGVPGADDGRNLSVFGDCRQLSTEFLSRGLPWAQYYVAAASITLFGDSPAGVRALFAILAASSFWFLVPLLRGRHPYPDIVGAIALLAPQSVLFARNARYFPLAMVCSAAVVWAVLRAWTHARRRAWTLTALALCFFQVHPVPAACCFGASSAFAALRSRSLLRDVLVAGSVGLAGYYAFYLSLEPIAAADIPTARAWAHGWWTGLASFLRSVWASVRDWDSVGAVPLVAWGALLFAATPRAFRPVREVLADPLGGLLFASIAIGVLGVAAVGGVETVRELAILRYQPALPVFGLALFALCVQRVASPRRHAVGLVLFVAAAASSPATLSFWSSATERRVSWWLPVYAELLAPPRDDWKQVLRTLASENTNPESTVRILPEFMSDVVRYGAGSDHYVLHEPARSAACDAAVRARLGRQRIARLEKPPTWVVVFGGRPVEAPGYVRTVLPAFRRTPDGTRPELTRHVFADEAARQRIVLFRRSGG